MSIKQPVTNCNRFGNAAKIREALLEARRFVSVSASRTDRDLLVMDDEKRGVYVLSPKDTLIKIDSALAAPPRNCDLYSNFDDAFEAHQRALEVYPLETHIDYDIWIFETAKGETDGSK